MSLKLHSLILREQCRKWPLANQVKKPFDFPRLRSASVLKANEHVTYKWVDQRVWSSRQ
jgi:hypothetical protein